MLEFMNDFRHILDPKVRSKRGGSKLVLGTLQPKVELPTSRREKPDIQKRENTAGRVVRALWRHILG